MISSAEILLNDAGGLRLDAGEASLNVGPLRLKGRAMLAPMAGVTDLGMRRIAQRFGATLVVSEMVYAEDASQGRQSRGTIESKLRAAGDGIDVHVVQIAACDPFEIGEMTRRAEQAGAAMIDINMGCPVKRVTGGQAGSALMRDLDQAVALIRAAIAATKLPVSLKMRLGWDETSKNAPELARRAEAEGIAMVSVHGRTRSQFFQGRADWASIGKVKKAVTIPVIANGDCASAQDAATMLAISGADAVMIGRAAQGQPWIAGQIAHYLSTGKTLDVPAAARKAAALEHYETLLELFGTSQGLRHARKHLAAYALHAPGAQAQGAEAQALRHQIVTSESPSAVKTMLSQLFNYVPENFTSENLALEGAAA